MRVGSDSTGALQSEGVEHRQIGRAPASRQGCPTPHSDPKSPFGSATSLRKGTRMSRAIFTTSFAERSKSDAVSSSLEAIDQFRRASFNASDARSFLSKAWASSDSKRPGSYTAVPYCNGRPQVVGALASTLIDSDEPAPESRAGLWLRVSSTDWSGWSEQLVRRLATGVVGGLLSWRCYSSLP
jgi:hypothetical protein